MNKNIDTLTSARALIFKMNDDDRTNLLLDLLVLISIAREQPFKDICRGVGSLGEGDDDELEMLKVSITLDYIENAVKLVEPNV